MIAKSLRLRLLLTAAVAICLAVGATGLVLVLLFTQYIETRVYTELESHLQQLTESVAVSQEGQVSAGPVADQRFAQPFSGFYWQVLVDGEVLELSRSLWDKGFELSGAPLPPGEFRRSEATGPDGAQLLVLDWRIVVRPGGTDRAIDLAVAADRAQISSAVAAFSNDMIVWMGLLAICLLLAASLQVTVGLKPLEVLRQRVANVKSGQSSRLAGDYPREVSPLVEEVNALLEMREKSIANARSRAGDLAHGLKTPLTILGGVARAAREKGDADAAEEIDEQIALMRRHVERELMRSRLAAHHKAQCRIAPVISRMTDAMQKLPRGKGIEWVNTVDPELIAPLDEQDAAELLGNLFDNARIWAAGRVSVSCVLDAEDFTLVIEDDGPGIPDDMVSRVLERGERLDRSKRGSGLGLAICNDIAAAYKGKLRLAAGAAGGLKVSLSVPARRA